MIFDATQLVVNQLNAHLKGTGTDSPVTLGNISQLIEETTSDSKKVIVTLVNLEEEAALKNGPHHRIKDGKVVYENRPVQVYLYLLFSANLANYSDSLKRIGSVIEFFQGKNVFTVRNSPHLDGLTLSPEELGGFRVTLELFSLTFEQINHLWGSLGGKQVPFVLYRVRLVTLTAKEILSSGPPITDVSLSTKTSYTYAS
ncbi:MAG: DUF4255 domain-containing protein [Akkermansiaceae bacterium]|nr:DUF4255 domain-containing protein [Akkermansiaceae bacterium]